MSGYCTVFGIDSHARTTTVCAVDASTGEVRVRTFRGNPYGEMAEWMAGFPQPSYGVYEAGCTGFVPARELSAEGRRVVPIATSHIPTSPDDRSRKTDRRDAERLARLALSGQAVEVWVPDGQTEGLRDLSRAIEDAAERRERCRMQVDAILLRHGYVWDRKTPQGRPVKRWGALHAQWLKGVRLADPASQAAYQAALEAERWASESYDGLVERAREAASSSALAPAVDAVQWLKGVGFVCALAFCAEVGDFSRFASGRRVTSYFGLAPSERSSCVSSSLSFTKNHRSFQSSSLKFFTDHHGALGRPGRPSLGAVGHRVQGASYLVVVASESRITDALVQCRLWRAGMPTSVPGGLCHPVRETGIPPHPGEAANWLDEGARGPPRISFRRLRSRVVRAGCPPAAAKGGRTWCTPVWTSPRWTT